MKTFFLRLIYLQFFLLTFGDAFSQSDCKYPEDYIPKDLNDGLEYLSCMWSNEDKAGFKSKDEGIAVSELHMGTGRGIRNGWELWKGKNSLVRYFNSKGIFHPDDMSSIILTSFHRQLNGKDIDLQGQIQYYQDYWKKADAANKIEAKKKKEEDRLLFESFSIGDSVSMKFAKGNLPKGLLLYKIEKEPLPWDETEKTCVVKGVIKRKKIIKNRDYVFVIEATDICGSKMAYHGNGDKDNLVVGQKFDYSISYFNIAKD